MRTDDRTHDRNDQNRNLRNPQQDRFSGQSQSQGQFRDDDRGLMNRAGDAMDRAGDAVRSWFGADEDQNQDRGDHRNQSREFRNYGQDGDESRRFQQGHNVGYSGQGYQGGMGNYSHGSQGQFGNPQSGQYGQSGTGSQYGQGQYGQGSHSGMGSQYGQGQYGQGGMGPQYGQSQYGQGTQSGTGSQYGQGQYGQGQYGQGQYGRREGSSRQGMQGNYGSGGSDYQGSQSWRDQGSFGQGMGQGQYSQSGTSRGRHVGRGPKGYKRSDERLTEEINEKLTRHPDIDAEEIEVKVQSGEVTLTGTVEDRQTKRMIEDLVEEISGVNELHNQLRVTRNRGQSSQGKSGAQGSQGLSSAQGSQSSQSTGLSSSSSIGNAGMGEHSSASSADKSRSNKSAS